MYRTQAKIVVWDQHTDETYRLTKQLASINCAVESVPHDRSPDPDSATHFVLFEGPWLDALSPQMRRKSTLMLCSPVTVHEIGSLMRRGYTKCITKTRKAAAQWPKDTAVYLPPLVSPGRPASDSSGGIISLINLYQKRDPTSFAYAKTFPDVKIYGFENPDGPCWEPERELAKAKYLLHIKHLGFLCNAVVKALAQGVPIIMDTTTWSKCGFDETIEHLHNAFIHNDPRSVLPLILSVQPKLNAKTAACRSIWSTPDQVAAQKVADLILRSP